MPGESSPADVTRQRDGSTWEIGTAADVDWIDRGTTGGLAITSGIPPVFSAYATVVVPEPDVPEEQQARDGALLNVLVRHSTQERWWLAAPAAAGAIIGSAIPLAAALSETWQYAVLAAAAVALLAPRRGVVVTLLAAGLAGAVAGLLGAPLPQ
jgi:hypothetical protein